MKGKYVYIVFYSKGGDYDRFQEVFSTEESARKHILGWTIYDQRNLYIEKVKLG
jgi:hypothetical protein